MSMITTPNKKHGPLFVRAVRLLGRVHRLLWWLRALTVGVRAIVIDDQQRVLLIRHSYRDGWHFPGGAVDRNETAEAAAIRELREEAAIECRSRPILHGFFYNVTLKRDHVACYRIEDFAPIPGAKPDWEIAEVGFFPVDALPEGTSRATRARLAEILEGQPTTAEW